MKGRPVGSGDPELSELRQKIGKEKFQRLYNTMYNHASTSNKRYSGKTYENRPEKLQAIKEKYKNGVTKEILDEFIKRL